MGETPPHLEYHSPPHPPTPPGAGLKREGGTFASQFVDDTRLVRLHSILHINTLFYDKYNGLFSGSCSQNRFPVKHRVKKTHPGPQRSVLERFSSAPCAKCSTKSFSVASHLLVTCEKLFKSAKPEKKTIILICFRLFD